MTAKERAADRATRLCRETLGRSGAELRRTRLDHDLSLADVGRAVGLAPSSVSRIERCLWPEVPLLHLYRIAEVIGLDPTFKLYPGGDSIRDAGQVRVLGRFSGGLHLSLRWATEVPLPLAGDRRSWDGMVAGTGWRYGAEAETMPRDAQALLRRLALKARDGGVDGVILVVPSTRRVRHFLREAGPVLAATFTVPGNVALARLARGEDPGGWSIVMV